MSRLLKSWIVALVFGFLGAVPSANAASIVWNLSGAFTDGGSLSGSFSADSVTGIISSWNITTGAGTIRAGFNYDSTLAGAQVVEPDGPWDVTFRNNIPIFSNPALVFDFLGLASPLGFASPGTFAISTSSFECDNCSGFRNIASGSVSTTPELSFQALLAMVVIGLLLHRRPVGRSA